MAPLVSIAIDVRSLCDARPSGVGHALFEILRVWPKSNNEIVLFSCGRTPPRLPRSMTERPNVRTVHRTIPNKVVNALIALRLISLERLVGRSIDAVWFPNTGFLPKTRARRILTVHDLAFHIMPETYTWKHRLRYCVTRAISDIRTADALIAISASTARDVATLKPHGRIVTIPHGVDHECFSPQARLDDDAWLKRQNIRKPYLLFLATIEPRKNVPSVVEAFDAVADEHPSLTLVIAGGHGWKRASFDRTLSHARHRERIRVLGYIEDEVRPALLRHALALCLPSRYEGFGMQVLEAMACGTPVVCSNNSGLLEVAGAAAVFVRAGDIAQLTRVLTEMVQNTTLRDRLCARGREQAQMFSWERAAQDTLRTLTTQYTPSRYTHPNR